MAQVVRVKNPRCTGHGGAQGLTLGKARYSAMWFQVAGMKPVKVCGAVLHR